MTARRRFFGTLVAGFAAVAVLLAGCSSDPYTPRPNHPARAAVATAGEPTPDAVPTAAPPAGPTAPAAAGFHTVDVPEIGARVAVRDDMETVDASVLASGEAGRVIDELAARIGLTHDQMVSLMDDMALFAVAPGGTNMSVEPVGTRRLPTPEDVRPMLESLGATDIKFSQRTTPLGPALVARFAVAVPTQAGLWAYQENLWGMSGTGLFVLAVATPDSGTLGPLFEAVVAALEPLPS